VTHYWHPYLLKIYGIQETTTGPCAQPNTRRSSPHPHTVFLKSHGNSTQRQWTTFRATPSFRSRTVPTKTFHVRISVESLQNFDWYTDIPIFKSEICNKSVRVLSNVTTLPANPCCMWPRTFIRLHVINHCKIQINQYGSLRRLRQLEPTSQLLCNYPLTRIPYITGLKPCRPYQSAHTFQIRTLHPDILQASSCIECLS